MEPPLTTRVEVLERRTEPMETVAVRREMTQMRDELREEIRQGDEQTRTDLRAEMRAIKEELRAEIRAGDEETRRLMRGLHEDILERFKTLGESIENPRRRSKWR